MIILRFLGTTPATSNIMSVYKSIIYQLGKIFSLDSDDIDSFKSVEKLTKKLFDSISIISERFPNKKVVFLLDSIDQLISSDYDLQWMLYSLPKNIKFVYSTLNFHGGILERIRLKIKN